MPKHAEFSRCGRSFHEVQVTRMGGERSWIGAVANLSTSSIGPPHWGQIQRAIEPLAAKASCSVCGSGADPSN